MGLKFVALCLVLGVSSIPVHAAELDLFLTGEAFDGGPAFTVRLGAVTVGSGVVDPIPASPEGAKFSFDVPDDVLAKADGLYLQLTNDKYEKGVGDRNLQVLGAKIGPTEFSSKDFVIVHVNSQILAARDGRLGANAQVAVAGRPKDGWNPVLPCDLTAQVEFSNAVISVPDEQQAALADLLQRAVAGGCAVTITGYSGSAGPTDANKQISQERAIAVSKYLLGKGAVFSSEEVIGAGETDQFGPAQADNRVVTVQLRN